MTEDEFSAYRAALSGDFSAPPSGGTAAVLWRSMARAAGLRVDPIALSDVGETPDVEASLACLQEVRARSLAFDAEGARAWLIAHRRCHAPQDSRSTIALHISETWVSLHKGAKHGDAEQLQELERAAREAGYAELVLEAASLSALTATEHDLSEATRIARRASRMARTEALPQLEYLANITLATVRRLNGEPHLAARIVSALRRVAPEAWHGWLAWEALLAGMVPEGSDHVSQILSRWLAARCEGDASQDSNVAALSAQLPAPIRHFELVLASLTASSPANNEWLKGEFDDVPGELCGVARFRGPSPEGETALAYVFAAERGHARRFLPLGFGGFPPQTRVLPQGRRKQARTASLLSTLALGRGHPLPVELVFERVYGFAYEAEIHHGVFNVLIHRARKYAEGVGGIGRDERGLWLEVEGPVVVPDPRCVAPEHDRVLQAVAAQAEPLTAKAASSAAGVSLRVAQIALKDLVEDGFCRLEKTGREARYIVEDTTFREPTQYR